MDPERQLLDNAVRHVTEAPDAFEALSRRKRWKERNRRAGIVVLAMSVAFVGVAGVINAFQSNGLAPRTIGAATRFPAPRGSVYPPAASWPAWGNPGGCPALVGTSAPNRTDDPRALAILSSFGKVSESTDLRASDAAYWPAVRAGWQHGKPGTLGPSLTTRNTLSGQAASSPYAQLIGRSCGPEVLARSWWIAVCPAYVGCSSNSDSALITHAFLLERYGHLLVWMIVP